MRLSGGHTRGRARLGLLAVLALAPVMAAACFPAALDESGRRCDKMDRPCGTGYVCFDGVCYLPSEVDAGPDNWLANGGFEQLSDSGFPLLWRALPASQGGDLVTDTQQVHEGERSVRLFSPDGGDLPGVMLTTAGEVRNTAFGQVWCARAWVRSNNAGGALGALLYIRERPNDGGATVGENTPFRARVTTEWTLLEERYVAEGAERMDVRITHLARIRKQDLLWVDDVRLKRSPTDQCTW